MTSTAILIPARYNSTRFPGKPLAMLDSIPMIKRVYDACTASKIPTYVLTDNMSIFNMFGADKCWIEEEHVAPYANGTERCSGAITKWHELKQYDQFMGQRLHRQDAGRPSEHVSGRDGRPPLRNRHDPWRRGR